MPAYVAHIGGRYEDGEVVYGTRLKVRLPAKRVPGRRSSAGSGMYEAERNDGEAFNDFVDRVGTERFEDAVKRARAPDRVQPRDDEHFIDWSRDEPFEVHPRRGRMRGLSDSPTVTDVLADAVERFHPRLVLPCSFQKEESVLIDMLMRARADARVFTIDTGVLFPETYATWKAVEDRYGVKVEVEDASNPDSRGPAATTAAAPRRSPRSKRALADVDAWITGIRREQAPTRATAEHGRVGREARRSGSSTRSPTGPRRTSGSDISRARPALPPAARPRLRRRSAARRAPCRAPAARAAGPAATRSSAGCTSRWTRSIVLFGLGVGILVGLDRHRRRLAHDAAADPRHRRQARRRRSAPTSPTARSRRPSAAGATATQAPSTSACRSGWRSARVPGARRSASYVLARPQDRSARLRRRRC